MKHFVQIKFNNFEMKPKITEIEVTPKFACEYQISYYYFKTCKLVSVFSKILKEMECEC